MSQYIFISTIVVSFLILPFNAHSDVLVKDTRINEIATQVPPSISSGDIETGDGEARNYVVLVCANDNGSGNNFNTPIPNGWTELDEGLCDGIYCAHGIWGGFADTPNSEMITCSWNPNSILFVAGSIRYTGVDLDNPIIDVACDSGSGSPLVAPSVESVSGSQVLRIFTWGAMSNPSVTNNSISTRLEGELLRMNMTKSGNS